MLEIISDSSTIIALEEIDSLPILCQIYSEVIIPEAVSCEIGNLRFEALYPNVNSA
jgi:predicted nucleic acid-binding protein